MKILTIDEIKAAVEKVAKEYDLKKVMLFGSCATGNATPESDIDLLVEFGRRYVSLLKILGVQNKVEELTGRSVDVIHAPIPRDSFLSIKKAVPIYG